MIHGVTASQLLGLNQGLTGTVMDFVNGQYVVDSVEYAISALFGTGSEGTCDFGAVVPGRGWLCTYDDINRPSAIGPLLAKLQQQHSAIIEWEDLEYFYEGMFIFVDGVADIIGVHQGFGAVFEIAGWGIESVPETNFHYFGVNKLGITLGAIGANHRMALNGLISDPITAPAHPMNSYDEIYPFGVDINSNGAIDGFVRKLTILDVLSPAELQARTEFDVPDMVTGSLSAPAKTSTTVTLDFSGATGATSYEYWFGPEGSSPAVNDYDWFPLAENRIATGLTPNTAYDIYVRSVNSHGPGGNDFLFVTVTTDP